MGFARTLPLLNGVRALNDLTLHVNGSRRYTENNLAFLQAFCCSSPPLEILQLYFASSVRHPVRFDLAEMMFVPSLQELIVSGVRVPTPSRTGTTEAQSATRHRSLQTLRLRNCTLDVDDFAFVYHLEGLETLELMNARSELLLANAPAWSNLPRQMPTLRALHIEDLENLTDDAVLSCIADGMSENSAFKKPRIE